MGVARDGDSGPHPGLGRMRVSAHVTRRTASLVRVRDEGPTRVFHVGRADPLGALLEDGAAAASAIEYTYGGEHPRDQVLAAHRDEVVVISVGSLDEAALDFVKRVSSSCPATLVVCDGAPKDRSILRETARSCGARTLIVREELGAAVLSLAVDHAREVGGLRVRHAELEERFDLAVRGANDGLWEWDLSQERVFYSQRWCELLGLPAGSPEDSPETWFDRVHPRDLEELKRQIELHLEGNTPDLQFEHRVRHADGEYRWILVRGAAARNSQGRARRLAGSFTDVTQYREHASTLRQVARQDAITDLPRRAVLVERLARALELARNYGDYDFTVLLIELDRLSTIVQGLGGRAADLLLAQVARRIEELCGPEVLLAHIERGQFAILLENLEEPAEGPRMAGQIHDALRAPFELEGEHVFVAVSIGMTSSARHYEQVDDVLADLTVAVRRARSGTGQPHEARDTQLRIEALTLLRLEMALHDAIEANQFELHFQPIVDYDRWGLFGFEALLRWRHPTRGMISPGEFIPVAEDTGLIVPIGRWALRAACKQIRDWMDAFEIPERFALSVNMSARQTNDPLLFDTLQRAIEEFRVPPGRLKLELTESAVMGDPDAGAALLERLRELGCALYIDDFGTGYSSLSYLNRLPIDGLKVDRSFVQDLDGSKASATMVQMILDLARNLEVDVVAEGVETDAQAEQLLAMGCNRLQGYYFSRPLAPDDADALVAEGQGAFRRLAPQC